MPGMTGYKLAFTVRTIRPDIPVIACTGFSSETDIISGELKINGILMKPFDKTVLAETVQLIKRMTIKSDLWCMAESLYNLNAV